MKADDLRSIQAADAARALAEEQRRSEAMAAMQAASPSSIMTKWSGANKAVLSFREIQELEEQNRIAAEPAAASIHAGAAFSGSWGRNTNMASTPSKQMQQQQAPKTPAAAPAAAPAVQVAPVVEEEEDIWGSKPSVPTPTVASKLAATFAAQPKDTVSKPAQSRQQQQQQGKTAASAVAASTPLAASASAAPSTPAKKVVENTFGGPQMSLEFENWCRVELEKISGSSDVTLVHFLLTLDSRSQIEEYIAEYLGQSDKTSKFTAGFLRFRDQALAKAHSASAAAIASPLPASAAAAAAAADKKRSKMNKKK